MPARSPSSAMHPRSRATAALVVVLLAGIAPLAGVAHARQPAAAPKAQPQPQAQPRNPDDAPSRPLQIPTITALPTQPVADDDIAGDQQGEELPYAPPLAIAPYVELLDSDDYVARQSAAEWIYSTPSIALPTIEPYLINASLSPETRSRLDAIGHILFTVTPRGAMGVQFERAGVAPIIIRQTVRDNPFFRAHEVLMPGDQVLQADGEPINTYDEFQGAILSHDPYETIRLEVLREGRTVELDVPLGDYMRLGNGTIPPEHVLRMAWDRRLSRIRAQSGGQNLTPSLDCRPPEQRPTHEQAAGQPSHVDHIRPSALVAGGLSRGAVDQDGNAIEASPLDMDAAAMEVRDYARQGRIADTEIRVEELRTRQQRLMDIRQTHRDQIEQIRLQLADPTLGPELRTSLTEKLARFESSLIQTQMLIDQINTMLPLGR